MQPLALFLHTWERCDHLTALHAYIARNVAGVLKPDELLRAEWVARVSALDLYVHELVAQRMLAIFNGMVAKSPAYQEFRIPNDAVHRIQSAQNPTIAANAFDLEVRKQLSIQTYQHPEKIAGGIRLCSMVELWNEVALLTREDPKQLKAILTAIVERRNKIAHEGDMQPTVPRIPWPIAAADLALVSSTIERIVRGIDKVVNRP